MALKNLGKGGASAGLKGESGAKARKTVGEKATDGLNPNVLADKLADLKKLVPEAFVEGKLDADLLQKMFKKDSVAGVGKEALAGTAEGERYGLSWAGKRYVYEEIAKQSVCTLTKDEKRSLLKMKGSTNKSDSNSPKGNLSEEGSGGEGGTGSTDSDNIFIEGENLEVLRTLQKAYFNKVKMIYIDPPYNTGKDFVYHDNFRQTEEDYCDECNVSENGHLTKALKLNSRDGGRFHSNWLNMIYPRLYLARNLLRDDGVIFVSIDDNEVHNLRMVMNEIFGEENFVAELIWHNKRGGGNDSKYIAVENEYILMFGKNLNQLPELFHSHSDEYLERYNEKDNKGKYFWDTFKRKSGKQYYKITCPDGTVLEKDNNNQPISWLRSEPRFKQDVIDGEIRFLKTKQGYSVHFKQRLPEGKKPRSILNSFGTTSSGNEELIKFFGNDKLFSNPKPPELIKHFIDFATGKDDLILDFFAGSGTTAHAVMAQNIADGGNRSYICVQMPEETPVGSEARKAGYEKISDIAIERVGRASAKLQAEHPDYAGDMGMQVYKATDSHFAQWQAKAYDDDVSLMQDIIDYANAKPEGTPRERVDEVLLKLGYPLTTPLEDMGDWYLADGKIALLLSEKFKAKDLMSVFDAKPTTVIVLEQIFKKDEEKINFDLRCGERKVIFQTI